MFLSNALRLTLTLAFAASGWPQAMTQYGVTAGAAAGGAAGRALSDSIDAALAKSEKATRKGATYVARPAVPDFSLTDDSAEAAPVATVVRIPSKAPSTGIAKGRSRQATAVRGRQPSRPAKAVAATAAAAAPVAATKPRTGNQPSYSLKLWAPVDHVVDPPTPERIAQVQNGEDVENLGGQLGVPANRVIIPGPDGRLWQRVKYKNAGRDVGVIYVADGKVVEVLPAGR